MARIGEPVKVHEITPKESPVPSPLPAMPTPAPAVAPKEPVPA